MAPRPFPSTLNIGTDIVLISRVTRLLNKDPARFLRRVLTPREHLAFKARFPRKVEEHLSISKEGDKHSRFPKVVEFIGGRWAAKEACIKAVQPRRLTLQQVEIWTQPGSKAPVAVILDESHEASAVRPDLGDGSEGTNVGSTLEELEPALSNAGAASSGPAPSSRVDFEKIEGQLVRVSISHDSAYCTAVALAPEMH